MEGIKCKVTNSNLSVITINKLVTGGTNQFTASFEFSEEWANLVKVAVFSNDLEASENCAIIDNKCTIPNILEGATYIEVAVQGLENENLVYSTNTVKRTIYEGANNQYEVPDSDLWKEYILEVNEAVENAESSEINAKASEDNSKLSEDNAKLSETNAKLSEQNALLSEQKALLSEQNAKLSEENAKLSETKTTQAYSDFLAQLGTDVATLVDGKIPASQIPSIATTEIYTVNSLEAQNAIDAQDGDICVRTDENKSYIYSNDGWVYLATPTDYAENAGYADTAGTAENATMINNKRIITMTDEEFETAVIDEDTFYFTYPADTEVV